MVGTAGRRAHMALACACPQGLHSRSPSVARCAHLSIHFDAHDCAASEEGSSQGTASGVGLWEAGSPVPPSNMRWQRPSPHVPAVPM